MQFITKIMNQSDYLYRIYTKTAEL